MRGMFARPAGVLLTPRWDATAEGSGEQTPWRARGTRARGTNDERGARRKGGGPGSTDETPLHDENRFGLGKPKPESELGGGETSS